VSSGTEVNKFARTAARTPRRRAIAAVAGIGVLAIAPIAGHAAMPGELGLQRGDVVKATKETPKDFTAAVKSDKHVVVAFLLPDITEDEIVRKRLDALRRSGRANDTTFITYRITGKTKLGDLPDMLDVRSTPTVAIIQKDDKVSSIWRGLVDEEIVAQSLVDARASSKKVAKTTNGAAGNPKGLALAKKVNAAYASTPGVSMSITGAIPGVPANSGPITAEVALKGGKASGVRVNMKAEGKAVSVIVSGSGAYVQADGQDCWTKAPAASAQVASAFSSVNEPILSMAGGSTFSAPVKKGANLVFTMTKGGQVVDITVAAKTNRIVAMASGGITINFTDLAKAPDLSAKPPC
jgi:hypothetical protein